MCLIRLSKMSPEKNTTLESVADEHKALKADHEALKVSFTELKQDFYVDDSWDKLRIRDLLTFARNYGCDSQMRFKTKNWITQEIFATNSKVAHHVWYLNAKIDPSQPKLQVTRKDVEAELKVHLDPTTSPIAPELIEVIEILDKNSMFL